EIGKRMITRTSQELLEEVTLGQSGLPLPVLEALSIEELLRLLDKNGAPDLTRGQLFAEILACAARVESPDSPRGQSLYHKTLDLFLVLSPHIDGMTLPLPGSPATLREILQKTHRPENREETWEIFRLFWRLGDFAGAEDYLFRLEPPVAPGQFKEGLAFFSGMETLSEETLRRGNFSRAEMREGREEWIRLAGESSAAGATEDP
ncbi:MAG TPA: DUF6483 family protein, partial [Calditrichia bacterium]|nr:DUF6483 family protein [Calditrichia bacterium]